MSFTNLQSNGESIYIPTPDRCPVCHFSIEVVLYSAPVNSFPPSRESYFRHAQVIFKCPRLSCGQIFVGTYAPNGDKRGSGYVFTNVGIYPITPVPFETTEEIETVSEDFKRIMTQAHSAESNGLDEIAGMGFRKALEFLIKDYCIKQNPEKEDEIRDSLLGKCISMFVVDPNVKECAKRAAWLGNDETHYVRRWSSHDINDLKRLITLTTHWISSESLTRKYLEEMDSGKTDKKVDNS